MFGTVEVEQVVGVRRAESCSQVAGLGRLTCRVKKVDITGFRHNSLLHDD